MGLGHGELCDSASRAGKTRIGPWVLNCMANCERRAFEDEPLVTVDDPFVTISFGVRSDERRIGASHFGFGHRRNTTSPLRHRAAVVALLLIVVGPSGRSVCMFSLVRRHAVEHPGANSRLTGFRLLVPFASST